MMKHVPPYIVERIMRREERRKESLRPRQQLPIPPTQPEINEKKEEKEDCIIIDMGGQKIRNARQVPRKKFKLLFGALILLALFDLIATISWLSLGTAEEANPLMDYLIDESMVLFALGKLFLTFVGIAILKAFRPQRQSLVLKVTWSLIILYVGIAIWHLFGFLHVMA